MADDNNKTPGSILNWFGDDKKEESKETSNKSSNSENNEVTIAGFAGSALVSLGTVLAKAVDPRSSVSAGQTISGVTGGMASYLMKDKDTETLGKAIGMAGKLTAEMFELSDSVAQYDRVMASAALMTGDFNQALEGVETGKFIKGWASVAAETGQSMDEVQKGYQDLFREGQFLATGLGGIREGVDETQKTFDTYNKAVQLARTTGMEFAEVSNIMKQAFESQGEAGDSVTNTLSKLSGSIKDTGLTMPQVGRKVAEMSRTFQDMGFNTEEAGEVLNYMTNQMKNLQRPDLMGARGLEAITQGMQGVAKAQQDLGQALFFTGLQGGGMEQAFDFMFDDQMTAMDRAKTMTQGIGDMFGGEILTAQEAKETGRFEEFAVQNKLIQQQFGLQSPQQAEKFASLMEAVAEGTATEEQTQEFEDIQKDQKQLHGEWYKRLHTSSEKITQILSPIQSDVAAIARSMGVSVTSGDAIQKMTGWMKEKLGGFADFFKDKEGKDSYLELQELLGEASRTGEASPEQQSRMKELLQKLSPALENMPGGKEMLKELREKAPQSKAQEKQGRAWYDPRGWFEGKKSTTTNNINTSSAPQIKKPKPLVEPPRDQRYRATFDEGNTELMFGRQQGGMGMSVGKSSPYQSFETRGDQSVLPYSVFESVQKVSQKTNQKEALQAQAQAKTKADKKASQSVEESVAGKVDATLSDVVAQLADVKNEISKLQQRPIEVKVKNHGKPLTPAQQQG